jgi:hypothetical protein
MFPIPRRLSPSFIVAVVAVFVALAGTAAAAGTFVVDDPSDLAPNVVTSPAIAPGSIQASDLSATATAPIFSAKVSANGTLVVGRRAISASRTSKGTYVVKFNRALPTSCIFVATARERSALMEVHHGSTPETIVVRASFLAADGASLFESTDQEFDLLGTC